MMHLLKSNIGPGLLSLPHVFSLLPLSLSSPIFLFIFVLATSNSLCLASVADLHPGSESFVALGQLAFGKAGRRLVLLSICMQQLSVCTVYFTFVASNLTDIAFLWPEDVPASTRTWICMVLSYPVFMSGVLLTNHISTLNAINAVATVMLFASLISILVISAAGTTDAHTDDEQPADDDLVMHTKLSFASVLTSSCALMYSFEGICLVLPIRAAVTPTSAFTLVYTSGITLVAAIYFAFSYAVASSLDNNVTSGSITAYLTADIRHLNAPEWLVHATNIMLTVMVLITYPLQFFPVTEIINDEICNEAHRDSSGRVSEKSSHTNYSSLDAQDMKDIQDVPGIISDVDSVDQEAPVEASSFASNPHFMKASLVTLTFLIAALVTNTASMISLAGSLAGSLSALILPPLIALRLLGNSEHWEESERSKKACVMGGLYVALLFGLVLMTAGTGSSIYEIVEGN
jgi:proton-coupled amino acid transporter